jgi:DNA topoisomerase-1
MEGGKLKLVFRGKSGVPHEVEIEDPRVVKIVRHCLHLPGQELFQYADDEGRLHSVSSGDVNDFLHELCGERFTAKDFRTWHGSVLALETICRYCKSGECFALKQLLGEVAGKLGNTPAVCRKAYIHPEVMELGTRIAGRRHPGELQVLLPRATLSTRGLTAAERRFVSFLSQL